MEGGKEKGVDEEGGYSDIYFVETKDIANYLIITKYKKKKTSSDSNHFAKVECVAPWLRCEET